MRLALACLAGLGLVALGIVLLREAESIAQWAITWQRAFQNEMATAIQALQTGQPGAWSALLLGAGAYGFVHAVGPGHGKYLIGGAGLGSGVSAARLLGLSVASSLAQSLWAIVLVYGGFSLLTITAQRMTFLAEDVLAPLSYGAIGLIGVMWVWRGVRSLLRLRRVPEPQHAHSHGDHAHIHDQDCGCGHAHGPTPEQAAKLGSLREALVLIGSIAIRPCTGAIFLLVIAWTMEFQLAGALAVMVMGLGTALLTSLVAVSSVLARRVTLATAQVSGVQVVTWPLLELVAGTLIILISSQMLLRALA